jgi:hypothetical protein
VLSPQHALAAHAQPQPSTAARGALALGLVGGLGEELLALLVAGIDYSHVHVAVNTAMGSATARFRPWQIGSSAILADDAFIAVTGDKTFVPAASPLVRFGTGQVVEAARIARGCGVSRLIVIAPLAALLHMGDAARTLDAETEIALREMGFERLLIVRPTAADAEHGGGLRGVFRSMGLTLADIMLPRYARMLSPRAAAAAITQAARTAPAGVTVLGARELLAIIEAQFPQLAPKKLKIR